MTLPPAQIQAPRRLSCLLLCWLLLLQQLQQIPCSPLPLPLDQTTPRDSPPPLPFPPPRLFVSLSPPLPPPFRPRSYIANIAVPIDEGGGGGMQSDVDGAADGLGLVVAIGASDPV